MKRSTKNRIITIFILLIFIGSTAAFSIISAFNTGNAPTGWSAQVAIVLYGEMYPIPADLGIINNETAAKIYTGDSDGIIHKSVSENVTLKDFFAVWNQTFNSTCILSYCNTNTSSMKMFVNGKLNTAYELYVIQDRDVIIIDYR